MGLNAAALTAIAETGSVEEVLAYASLHSAQPDAAGSNETTAARLPISWGVASNGVTTAADLDFTGVASNGAAAYIGFRSGASGTWYGWIAVASGDTQANAAGEYTFTGLTATVANAA